MAEVYMAKATKEKLDELHNHKLIKAVYKQNSNKRSLLHIPTSLSSKSFIQAYSGSHCKCIKCFAFSLYRRTSGGVFLSLLKHRYVTKEQSKWIFAIENEISKKKAKEEQQRMTEFKKKTVSDLRLKLKERERDKESKN